MSAPPLVPPIDRPDIVVPDAAPLVHLAAAGLLHLLHEVGSAVVVVDMVAHEVTREPDKPGAAALRAWLAEGQTPGSDRPIRVEDTEPGRLCAAVLESRPDHRLRTGAGRRSSSGSPSASPARTAPSSSCTRMGACRPSCATRASTPTSTW